MKYTDEELFLICITSILGANNLIHLFCNEPDKVFNNYIQVDPIIHDLLITVAHIKDRLGLS
jgi:hypothetical protein